MDKPSAAGRDAQPRLAPRRWVAGVARRLLYATTLSSLGLCIASLFTTLSIRISPRFEAGQDDSGRLWDRYEIVWLCVERGTFGAATARYRIERADREAEYDHWPAFNERLYAIIGHEEWRGWAGYQSPVDLDFQEAWARGELLIVPLAGVSVIVWRRARRAQSRGQEGRCARCGYDLRATPARCPECGAAAGE